MKTKENDCNLRLKHETHGIIGYGCLWTSYGVKLANFWRSIAGVECHIDMWTGKKGEAYYDHQVDGLVKYHSNYEKTIAVCNETMKPEAVKDFQWKDLYINIGTQCSGYCLTFDYQEGGEQKWCTSGEYPWRIGHWFIDFKHDPIGKEVIKRLTSVHNVSISMNRGERRRVVDKSRRERIQYE